VSNCGAAYVFTFDGLSWSLDDVLRAADSDAGDEFGASVGVSGSAAVIGATGDDAFGSNAGAVYAFDHSGSWTQSEKLANFFTDQGDQFGNAVAIDGSRFVAGARVGGSGPGSGTGHVAIYQRVGGLWQEDLLSPIAPLFVGATDGYGTSVAIDGTILLAGAPANSEFASGAGRATFVEVDLAVGGDSDNDGLSDSEELNLAALNAMNCPSCLPNCPDPFDADSDDDGLLDGDENFIHNTNACLADTDSD
jgi:hypothetical protein